MCEILPYNHTKQQHSCGVVWSTPAKQTNIKKNYPTLSLSHNSLQQSAHKEMSIKMALSKKCIFFLLSYFFLKITQTINQIQIYL